MLRAGTSRLWTLSATFSFSFFVSRLCEHVHGSIDAHNGVDESVSEQNYGVSYSMRCFRPSVFSAYDTSFLEAHGWGPTRCGWYSTKNRMKKACDHT
jgi:hypothetical protein